MLILSVGMHVQYCTIPSLVSFVYTDELHNLCVLHDPSMGLFRSNCLIVISLEFLEIFVILSRPFLTFYRYCLLYTAQLVGA